MWLGKDENNDEWEGKKFDYTHTHIHTHIQNKCYYYLNAWEINFLPFNHFQWHKFLYFLFMDLPAWHIINFIIIVIKRIMPIENYLPIMIWHNFYTIFFFFFYSSLEDIFTSFNCNIIGCCWCILNYFLWNFVVHFILDVNAFFLDIFSIII